MTPREGGAASPQARTGADRGARRGGAMADGDGAQGWPSVVAALRRGLGAAAHARWIAPLALSSVENGVARLLAPSPFIADYVTRSHAEAILTAMRAAQFPVERLVIAAGPRVASGPVDHGDDDDHGDNDGHAARAARRRRPPAPRRRRTTRPRRRWTRASPSRALWWASPTSWRTRRRGGWRRARRSPTTRCSCTAASGWARRT